MYAKPPTGLLIRAGKTIVVQGLLVDKVRALQLLRDEPFLFHTWKAFLNSHNIAGEPEYLMRFESRDGMGDWIYYARPEDCDQL